MRETALERAIERAGGVSALARALGVSQPAVSGWKRVPPDRVLAIETATGIPRTELRPDLYAEAELVASADLDEVDSARADLYALIAHLLWHAPDTRLLHRLAEPVRGSGPLGEVRRSLAEAAAASTASEVAREHFNLFTGVGGSELLPYASYYLTGFIHERPLAEVRADLAELDLVRTEGLSEPEDHVAFLFEVMTGLIRRTCGTGGITDETFFAAHLRPWAGHFFADLEAAETASFYRTVGRLGRVLITIETEAFGLASSREDIP